MDSVGGASSSAASFANDGTAAEGPPMVQQRYQANARERYRTYRYFIYKSIII